MSKELERLGEVRLTLNQLIGLLEDIFVADNEPIKETIKNAKHALKQIPKIETALKRLERYDDLGKTNISQLYPKSILTITDLNQIKAFEIIKELFNLRIYEKQGQFFICSGLNAETPLSKEKADLLKEVLL